MEKQYCVYIMTNAYNTVLYTGVTNDLQRRVLEHKHGKGGGFTKRYNINKMASIVPPKLTQDLKNDYALNQNSLNQGELH